MRRVQELVMLSKLHACRQIRLIFTVHTRFARLDELVKAGEVLCLQQATFRVVVKESCNLSSFDRSSTGKSEM